MALTKLSGLNLIGMPDCVALTEAGCCSRLNISKCPGSACLLKTTCAEEAATAQKVMARLRTLDEKTQAKIARKYYGGRRVWDFYPGGRPLTGNGGVKHV